MDQKRELRGVAERNKQDRACPTLRVCIAIFGKPKSASHLLES